MSLGSGSDLYEDADRVDVGEEDGIGLEGVRVHPRRALADAHPSGAPVGRDEDDGNTRGTCWMSQWVRG